MKHRQERLRCIFTLPLILLLLYCGAALSNVLPDKTPDTVIADRTPGAAYYEAERAYGDAPESAFREPAWIDFNVCRMLYDGLTPKGKEAYEALYDAVLEHKETVYIPMLSSQELSNVHAALKYDNPQLPCISDEFSYGSFGTLCYVKMRYDYTEAECRALSETMISAARSICDECADRGDYEKELYLHDALVRLADYSDGGVNANTAAGALVDRNAVCAGYALGMKLLCDISGIDSCVVRGTAESDVGAEAHAWLIVKIGGEWYHVDPTWDDPVNENDRDQLTHAYFNLPTEWIKADHRDFTLPEGIACEETADNYFVRSGLYCEGDDWRGVLKDAAGERFRSLPFETELRFADGALFDGAYEELMDGEINKVINELVRENGLEIERWRVSVQMFRSMNCLRLIISEDEG